MSILLVAIGGFAGANARYFVGVTFNRVDPLRPFGTWIANITGSFLLGFLFVATDNNLLPSMMWTLLGTGFCGAYTTFSTFGTELVSMLVKKAYRRAILYAFSSIAISLLGVFIILVIY
ncbi:fluoride efflux transporter CrcB [Paraliobacillus ryukyuensis]|uniref:fluoride efflux transporter CrcB n=1 Tax=Paraliobacillus ryukyuensis TaxID=200904 RepID=UPI0009A6B09E|nr:fluoride efflux transporter CrcB [Paraliobacillus ryukyuensis]